MSHGEQYSTDVIIKALEETHGAVTLAADRVGCSYKTIERRAEKVQAVRDVIEKYRERRLDKAELKLEQAVDKGEAWAIIFTLKTQGKKRGYVERNELTGANGEPVPIRIIEIIKDTTDAG